MIKSFKRQYKDFFQGLALYSRGYGGFTQIFASPYFLLAIIFTGLSFNVWLSNPDWEKVIVTSAPPLIAFSLGAIAIFNSIGDSKFRDALLDAENGDVSPYVEINSMFVHFIFVQTIAFLIALISQSAPTQLHSIIGDRVCYGEQIISAFKAFAFLIFAYGAMQILATALAILRISNSISNIHNITKEAGAIEESDTRSDARDVTINENIYIDKVIYKYGNATEEE